MDNKKISTKLGVAIIIIFAITVIAFVLVCDKNRETVEIKNNPMGIVKNKEPEKSTIDKSLEEVKNNQEQMNQMAQQNNKENIYTNQKYNFQITVPSDWKIKEYAINASDPVFTFYKDITSPNDNEVSSTSLFTEGTFVIVRPYGQATSGLSGKTLPSVIKSSENTKTSLDYILKNESRWATFINFKNNPKSWEESGFIFGRNVIQNEKKFCERNGSIINEKDCDLWNGDVIIYDGYVNELDRKQIEKILSSFKFIL
ncbi:MAG: hypothetical protein ACD_15C00082G0001 [uncultured bacterium]|nr:MAG: hypothetical protein ACD_15C00082G0001 [uncultured bacterium]